MLKDWRDLPITAGSDATVDGVDNFSEGLLSYETKAAAITEAADEDPESPIANAYAALFHMFLETRTVTTAAAPYVERAEAAAIKGTRRERMVVQATRAWVENDIPRAIAISEQLADEYPRELATAKVCQYHYFNRGDAAGMLRIASKIVPANPEIPYVHGMAAFAYEQAHLLSDAERSAQHAIALRRKEPWAHHALAHVMLAQGRTGESRQFLDGVKDTWTDLNSFMFTHNWWHLALVLLDLGEVDAILSFYDRTIWGVSKEYSQDQVGAVSLLARLELVGVDVGDRWSDVGTYLARRVDDHVLPFLSIHYLYGLARAERSEATVLMDELRTFAAAAPEFCRSTWMEVAIPASEGLLAHARGQYEVCVQRLGSVLSRLVEIGGSHAQRDLFNQVWIDALIQTRRFSQAQQCLEQRRAASPEAGSNYAKLAHVYRSLDLPMEATRLRQGTRSGIFPLASPSGS